MGSIEFPFPQVGYRDFSGRFRVGIPHTEVEHDVFIGMSKEDARTLMLCLALTRDPAMVVLRDQLEMLGWPSVPAPSMGELWGVRRRKRDWLADELAATERMLKRGEEIKADLKPTDDHPAVQGAQRDTPFVNDSKDWTSYD